MINPHLRNGRSAEQTLCLNDLEKCPSVVLYPLKFRDLLEFFPLGSGSSMNYISQDISHWLQRFNDFMNLSKFLMCLSGGCATLKWGLEDVEKHRGKERQHFCRAELGIFSKWSPKAQLWAPGWHQHNSSRDDFHPNQTIPSLDPVGLAEQCPLCGSWLQILFVGVPKSQHSPRAALGGWDLLGAPRWSSPRDEAE